MDETPYVWRVRWSAFLAISFGQNGLVRSQSGRPVIAGFVASLPFVVLGLLARDISDDWVEGFAPLVIGYAAVLGSWCGSPGSLQVTAQQAVAADRAKPRSG